MTLKELQALWDKQDKARGKWWRSSEPAWGPKRAAFDDAWRDYLAEANKFFRARSEKPKRIRKARK